jgi:hypothetical protein
MSDKIPDTDEWWLPKPCEGSHVFVWVSNTTADKYAPKGTECKCGTYKADGKGGILEEPNNGH